VGQSDPNLTIYKITLEREESGIIYEGSAYVQYVSQGVETVASPIQAQDLTNTYYHVYNYQHFINLINDAFISALLNLRDNMTGDGAFWQSIPAPYLEWDAGSCTVSLLIPTDTGHIPMGVCFNTRLYELFVGLNSTLISESGEKNYRMRAKQYYGHTEAKRKDVQLYYYPPGPLSTGDYVFIQSIQETSSIAAWNPIASIVFASTLLPIQPTQTSMPKDIGQSSNKLKGGGNNSNLLNILSDFAIAVGPNNEYRPIVEYVPQSEYRLLDMNSSMNLNRVDVHVYWKDQLGVLHPLLLRPGCSAHVKLMFRREDFDVVI